TSANSAPFNVLNSGLIGTTTVTADGATSATVTLTQNTVSGQPVLILISRQANTDPDSVTSITGPFSATPVLITSKTFVTKYNLFAYWATGNGSGGNIVINFAQSN